MGMHVLVPASLSILGPFPVHRKPALHPLGAPTLKGEPKAWKVRGSIPQPRCPEKGQAWDHGGGLSPPHAGSSGRSGFSRRVWRSLQLPWTLPQDLEEKSRQQGTEGRGGRGTGESQGIRLQPLGEEAGGSHTVSSPPRVPRLATIRDTPTPGTPSGSPCIARHPPHHVTLLGHLPSSTHTHKH